jgi:cytochrome subunit of sulfide dehydrogenase
MSVNNKLAIAAVAALLCSGPAMAGKAKAKAAEPCLIAGWENPPSVCVAHTRVIVATCFNCHGPNGKSSSAIPTLAGQDKAYFLAAMNEFKNGQRESTVMKKYALGYTDEEYAAMGEYFAKIK